MSVDYTRSVLVVASSEAESTVFGTAFVVRTTKTFDTVVTCAHVVRDVTPRSILVGGRKATVVTIGDSDAIDLAVLRIQNDGQSIALRLAYHPTTGDDCTIIAFSELAKAAGLETIPATIGVSRPIAQRRTGEHASAWELTLLEHELLPGNSGAPVIDRATGFVVGVLSHRLGQTHTGLALATENLKLIWRDAPFQNVTTSGAHDDVAVRLDLHAWMPPLQRSRLTADRLLLEHQPQGEDALFLRFEEFLDAAHAADLRIYASAGPSEALIPLRDGRSFRAALLATLIRSSESSAKWAVAKTVETLAKRQELPDDSMLLAVWRTVCADPRRGEEVERILRVLLDEMRENTYRKHERLYWFVTFLLDRVAGDEATVRIIADKLREHDDALGNDAPPAYLERVKRLYGQAVAKAEANRSGTRTFAPDVALIGATELCPYEFEAMIHPLTVGERGSLSGRSVSAPTTLPYVFEFQSSEGMLFNLLSSEVTSLKNLCNDFNGDEQYVWDVPTICEWLALAGCIEHPFPWGNTPPTPEKANLAFTEHRRIKPVGTYPKGASSHKTLDCCGNVHEIVVSSLDALSRPGNFPGDYRLMGGCFRTSPSQASCHLVRPFRPKEKDDRKNVGLRLIRFSHLDRERRKDALTRFLTSGHRAARLRPTEPFRPRWPR
jgi:hypothetical protein